MCVPFVLSGVVAAPCLRGGRVVVAALVAVVVLAEAVAAVIVAVSALFSYLVVGRMKLFSRAQDVLSWAEPAWWST